MATPLDTSTLPLGRMRRRRAGFFTVVFVLTCVLSWLMADLLWRNGLVRGGIVSSLFVFALFVVLTANVSLGFCQAVFGYLILRRRGGDPVRISRSLGPEDAHLPLAPTAVVMPIYNEDVSRVLEGLRVIYRSVEATGQLQHFDFFILSDSNDPNKWIQEEVSWLELCKQVGGLGRIFYRKRRIALNKKSGNVADFLRRWGKRYRYMVVLDADSVMTGEALVRLVRLMEKNPRVGIVQTAPQLVNAESLYGRLQQFSARLYGPIFAAGLNYWQQAEGNYWGHNAIIRVGPFIEHCGLPELPGAEPFGGKILSHDYVEAALMRKAGYQVWLAYDLEGSYEEGPPSLIDAAKRDRRWCQGNLQHAWLLGARGLQPVNRLHLALGILSYAASPLWLLFLLFSTLHTLEMVRLGTDAYPYFPQASTIWNVPAVPQALALFGFVFLMLFGPKFLAFLHACRQRGERRDFGGGPRLFASMLFECVVSVLLAPIQMLFHSKFVLYTLLGQGVGWATQNRAAEDGTDWREAILTHGWMTLLGLLWGAAAWLLSHDFFLWLSPVIAGLVLSVPVSILLSKQSLGQAALRARFLQVPEEGNPPFEIARLRKNLSECYKHPQPLRDLRPDYGLMQAVLDPYVNAMHVSLLRQRRSGPEETREHFERLRDRLLREGPQGLSSKDKHQLLLHAESMQWLHRTLWSTPAGKLAGWWKLAMRQYNVLTQAPVTALYR